MQNGFSSRRFIYVKINIIAEKSRSQSTKKPPADAVPPGA
jgi:hypothetical protein